VSKLRVVAAMAITVASVMCCTAFQAHAEAPTAPSFLLFAGTDLWRYGAFLYGGTVWAPRGLDADGFAFKALLNGGRYTFSSGDLHTDVDGTMFSAATMPGWRLVRDGLTVGMFAGPAVQDYRLKPYDPGSRLHGLYAGAQFSTEVWYQPTQATMAAVSGSIASIGPTGSLRASVGWRTFDALFVGPETAALWCGEFQELQFGAHVTGFRFNGFEWSGGGGWTITSDRRAGPYLRLGVSSRY
jgi:hypothetical protein